MYVAVIDEPFKIQLTGLSGLIVGGYLGGQRALFVQFVWFDGCFKYP